MCLFFLSPHLNKENKEKSDNSPSKREIIVVSDEKLVEKTTESTTLKKILENELFFPPLHDDIENTTREKYRKGEGDDVGKYMFSETFSLSELMKRDEEYYPSKNQSYSESIDVDSISDADEREHELR